MYKRIPLLLSVFTLITFITLPALGQVRINEISHGEVDFMGTSNWVELYNEGDSEANVADLWLCDFPAYPQINTLTVLSGSTTIPAGGYLVLAWTNLDDDAEVGLYSSQNFGDSTAVLDYMQYASAGHQREGVAEDAGEWVAGEFVALAATGESLQFFDSGSAGAADWASAPATPGEENAQASSGGVRINEISHGEVDFMGTSNWVELYNEGDSEINVADLWLCDFPAYPQINTLTVLSGSTTIPAGGYLVLAWTNLDDDAEVGLYSSQNFGDSTAVLDYMQYASAGHQREGVAEDAGEWVAGEFVALAATGESLQFFDSGSVGAADWASAPATPGEENAMVSTSNDEFDALPEDFQLFGNYPNPFNPTTTISYDLSNAGHVMLKVYSVLGREIATLVDGVLPVGSYETAWDGRDSQGEVVPSGMYLYRLTFGNGQSQSRVMTLLK